MRIFYSTLLKRYVLIAGISVFVLMALIRLLYPSLNFQEITWHAKLRGLAGQSATFYASLALFTLTVLYQLLYFFLGGVLGYILFRIKHRNHGFSILISRRFLQIFCVFFIVLTVFFINVDSMNKYQSTFVMPQIAIGMPQGIKDKILSFFVPPMASIGKPQQASPGAPVYTPSVQTNNPVAQPQTPVVNNPQPQPVYQKPVPQVPVIPVQTKKGASPSEIHAALNSFRQRNGLQTLAWDNGLANLAAKRTAHFNQIGRTDGGASFGSAVGPGGVKALGFLTIGEVTAYGITYMSGTEMIDGYFAKYPSTNIQLIHQYSTHVGISVDGNAVAIVFGGQKT